MRDFSSFVTFHLSLLLLLVFLAGDSTVAQLPPRIDPSWFDAPLDVRTFDAFRPPAPFAADDATPDQEDVGDKHTLRLMKELSAACKTNQQCVKKSPFEKIPCIRKCVSDNCYASVYAKTPLEVGEVDVNYEKYKRCFLNVYKNKYRSHIKKENGAQGQQGS